MSELQKLKVTIELDSANKVESEVIRFIQDQTAKMKESKSGIPLSKAEILLTLLPVPGKGHEKKVKESFLSSFSGEDKLNAIFRGYTSIKGTQITLADFSLNHLGNINARERKSYIARFLEQ